MVRGLQAQGGDGVGTTPATAGRCPGGPQMDGEVDGMATVDAAEVRQEIAERGQGYVSEATGFDQGDEFETEAQVREYFTVDNIRDMFGECPYTQEDLDLMAEAVIDGGWHMA